MSDGHGRSTDGFGIDRESSTKLIVKTAMDNGVTDSRQIAYMLATAQHESENFRAPDEHFGMSQAKRLGYRGGEEFFGRGYAHLTHIDNYQLFDKVLKLDGKLVKSPELAKDPEIAARILVIGMRDGLFTGKRLDRYINDETHDLYNARRTVNGVVRSLDWSVKAAEQCQSHAEEWEEKVPAIMEDVRKHGVVLRPESAKRGNDAVEQVQQNLNALGFPDGKGRPLVADGDYGSRTKQAIESFQRQHGMLVDGKVSQQLLAATQIAVSVNEAVHSAQQLGRRYGMGPDAIPSWPGAPYAAPRQPAARHPEPAPLAQFADVHSRVESTESLLSPHMAPATPAPTIAPSGLDRATVEALQQNLNRLGFTDARGRPLAEDGRFGPSTQAAVTAFQHEHGLPANGVADPGTLKLAEAFATLEELQHGKAKQAPVQPEAPVTTRAPQEPAGSPRQAPQHTPLPPPNAAPPQAPAADWTAHDPRKLHAEHYTTLKNKYPQFSEEQLTAYTATIHKAGIPPNEPLYKTTLWPDGTLSISTAKAQYPRLELDTTTPVPPIPESAQAVVVHDQQRQAERERQQAEQQARGPSGPALH